MFVRRVDGVEGRRIRTSEDATAASNLCVYAIAATLGPRRWRNTPRRHNGTLAPATKKKVAPEGTRPSVFEKTAHPSILGCEELVLGY